MKQKKHRDGNCQLYMEEMTETKAHSITSCEAGDCRLECDVGGGKLVAADYQRKVEKVYKPVAKSRLQNTKNRVFLDKGRVAEWQTHRI